MSGNYPPGVTGMEPEIVGYPERDAYRECGADARVVGMTVDKHLDLERAEQMLSGIGRDRERTDVAIAREISRLLQSVLVNLEPVDMVCPFEGDVTLILSDEGAHWECPLCHTQRTEEHEAPEYNYDEEI